MKSAAASRPILGHVVHGQGDERVLVLHDWNGDHTSYVPVMPYLDGTTFTYVFVDLRGYGKSRGLTGDYTVEEISGDCLALADHLGWDRFHIVAHSMTGMATQRIAADAPQRIKSAVAVCPISAAGSPVDDATLGFLASTSENDDNFRRLINFVSSGYSSQWSEAKLRQGRESVEPAARAGYLAMFSGTGFVEDICGLATPFLIIVAESDPGLDEAAMNATFLAWHPNAELVTIRSSGHYPMQERPPHFATVLEDFLRKIASLSPNEEGMLIPTP